MCLHTQQESGFGELQKECSLSVARVEHRRWLSLHQRAVQKNFTGKLCRTTVCMQLMMCFKKVVAATVKLIINEYVKEERFMAGGKYCCNTSTSKNGVSYN